jgi:hypothetical protein
MLNAFLNGVVERRAFAGKSGGREWKIFAEVSIFFIIIKFSLLNIIIVSSHLPSHSLLTQLKRQQKKY